jgi:hypothetical protein
MVLSPYSGKFHKPATIPEIDAGQSYSGGKSGSIVKLNKYMPNGLRDLNGDLLRLDASLIEPLRIRIPVGIGAKPALFAHKHFARLCIAFEVIPQPVSCHIGKFSAAWVEDGGRVPKRCYIDYDILSELMEIQDGNLTAFHRKSSRPGTAIVCNSPLLVSVAAPVSITSGL